MKCCTRETALWAQCLLSSRQGLSFNPCSNRRARGGDRCLCTPLGPRAEQADPHVQANRSSRKIHQRACLSQKIRLRLESHKRTPNTDLWPPFGLLPKTLHRDILHTHTKGRLIINLKFNWGVFYNSKQTNYTQKRKDSTTTPRRHGSLSENPSSRHRMLPYKSLVREVAKVPKTTQTIYCYCSWLP